MEVQMLLRGKGASKVCFGLAAVDVASCLTTMRCRSGVLLLIVRSRRLLMYRQQHQYLIISIMQAAKQDERLAEQKRRQTHN